MHFSLMRARVFLLTALAMLAFASNSLLCRAALQQTRIDPASFTFVRLVSGALVLALVLVRQVRFRKNSRAAGSWWSALALCLYAAAFSFAYTSLAAGTGALLLFGAVQATMILWGIRCGERLRALQFAGLFLALLGLVVLVYPGLSAPSLGGSLLMTTAGIAWGAYSLRGKGEKNPAAATAGNFLRAIPFALVVSLAAFSFARVDRAGVIYALLSGAITSGLGYVIWYAALPSLRAASAASVQLSVPVLAAGGGILLLGEPLTWRYGIASVAILGGIALVLLSPARGRSFTR